MFRGKWKKNVFREVYSSSIYSRKVCKFGLCHVLQILISTMAKLPD